MEEEIARELQRRKEYCIDLCYRLQNELNSNKDDCAYFFGGELKTTYQTVTERAADQVRNIRNKIRNV